MLLMTKTIKQRKSAFQKLEAARNLNMESRVYKLNQYKKLIIEIKK